MERMVTNKFAKCNSPGTAIPSQTDDSENKQKFRRNLYLVGEIISFTNRRIAGTEAQAV